MSTATATVAGDRDFPAMTDHTATVEPVPRRIRGVLGGRPAFDTTSAVYVWDSAKYPAYHIPVADLDQGLLGAEGRPRRLRRGTARTYDLRLGDVSRPGGVRIYDVDADPGVAGTARFEWAALDAWYEEDEQVFVHPRNPYTRVDALRSSRHVQVELDGTVLATSNATVMVFETGLPTRYYFDRTSVNFEVLQESATVTECPYKGRTTGYWTAHVGDQTVPDIAWSYDFPTRALSPIANLVAFYDEHTDLTLDGHRVARPGPVG